MLARVACSDSRNRGSNSSHTRMVIVDHGNPGAWYGTSATEPATTVACASDAEVLAGLIGVLDSHELIFGRLMGLADAIGCRSSHLLTLTLLLSLPSTGITHKADNLVVAGKAENQNLAGDAAESKTETSAVQMPPPDTSISNALFTDVTNLNEHLKTIHAALPPRTAHLFSGYNDPR